MADTDRFVTLAFLTVPLDANCPLSERILTAIAHFIAGAFEHVEIIFEDAHNPACFYTCSVLQHGKVFFQEKGFSRDGYQYLRIGGLRAEQVERMQSFCEEECAKGSSFNPSGFYRVITPFPQGWYTNIKRNRTTPLPFEQKLSSSSSSSSYDYDKLLPKQWFCSQLITSALQAGGLLEGYIATCMTPKSVYDAVYKTVPRCQLYTGTNPFASYRVKKRIEKDALRTFHKEKTEGEQKIVHATKQFFFLSSIFNSP